MPTVTSVDTQFPTPAQTRRTPFPQASQSFDRVLIAAADLSEKREGVARPMPSRASALRMPLRPLNMTTGIPAIPPSSDNTVRPLPLSQTGPTGAGKPGGASVQPLRLTPGISPSQPQEAGLTGAGELRDLSAQPLRPTPGTPLSVEALAQQVLLDHEEYQRMRTQSAAGTGPTATPVSASDVARPYAQALATKPVSPEPDARALLEGLPTRPAPFPRRGEIPMAEPQAAPTPFPRAQRSWKNAVAAYKDEQLLANAGGDNYIREGGTVRMDPSYDHSRVTQRVGKDLRDAAQNLKDAAGDLSSGSTGYARSPSGEVVPERRPGLFRTLGNFAKDVASGVTLGLYHPKDEPAPGGFGRIFYPFKKIVVDGVVKDLVVGVPSSLLRAGEHTTLAALNTAETVPDATIGRFGAGRKLTSAAFDTAQVGVSYAADVLPAGDAWARVGASGRGGRWGLPVVSNLKAPEYEDSDPRFANVRNTPFRKGIETIGTLGAGTILSAATAPAAVFGASAAVRAGNHLNAREVAQPGPSPDFAPVSPLPEQTVSAPSPAPPPQPLPVPERVAWAVQTAYAPLPALEQEPVAARRRPKLWETY